MEELLEGIKDPHFRTRFVYEYEAVRRWSSKVETPGCKILDFGCGQGIAALAFALRDPTASVSGVDVGPFHQALPALAQRNLGRELPGNLEFHVSRDGALPFADESLDLVYSWSVFEHIRRDLIPVILKQLLRVLKPNGHLFIQIEPLFFSPRGSHLYNILETPWVHLLEQHDVLIEKVKASDTPEQNKTALIRQYESLNRITADDLFDHLVQAGFEILRKTATRCDQVPPDLLRRIYTEDALRTNSVHVLAAKGG